MRPLFFEGRLSLGVDQRLGPLGQLEQGRPARALVSLAQAVVLDLHEALHPLG